MIDLAEGSFGFEHMNEIFQVCTEVTAKDVDFRKYYVYIDQNERASIIKEICHIDFPFLTHLKLSIAGIIKVRTIFNRFHPCSI